MKWEHVRFREKRKTRSFKEKKRCRFLRLCDFTVCAQCTAVIAVLSSTEHCSDIFHLLPLDPISTETFRSHLLFVKVSTQLCHLWAGCLRQAGHISQAVNLQSNTNSLPISLRVWGLHQKHKSHIWLGTESQQAYYDSHSCQFDPDKLCMHVCWRNNC